MRFFSVLLLTVSALLVGCQNQQPTEEPAAPATEPVVFNEAGAPTVVFAVEGMACGECAKTVRGVLTEQPGVVDAMVDLPAKRATVAISEGDFNPEAAIAALAEKSYTATLSDPQEPPAEEAEPSDADSEG